MWSVGGVHRVDDGNESRDVVEGECRPAWSASQPVDRPGSYIHGGQSEIRYDDGEPTQNGDDRVGIVGLRVMRRARVTVNLGPQR